MKMIRLDKENMPASYYTEIALDYFFHTIAKSNLVSSNMYYG
jgi:hypothetical protein